MSQKPIYPLKNINMKMSIPKVRVTRNQKATCADQIKRIINLVHKDLTSQPLLIRELRQIYIEMDHDEFIKIIMSILMFLMQQPEDDSNANKVLLFLCNFLASYKHIDSENPCKSIFNIVLNTDGTNQHIRFRLCELLNTLLVALGDATLDEAICDQILTYMINRLKNPSPNLRAQAISALERLQVPADEDDVVINYFIYHMQTDPSPKVREAAISKITRNAKTIPFIMERLQDTEERVRRHTYIEMMKGIPVTSYRVAQRITVLESGLTDESLSIRKIVAHLMITEWLVSYNEDYILFLRALKLNGSNENLLQYHNTAKQVLRHIFQKVKLEKLLVLSACDKETDCAANSDEENEELTNTQLKLSIPIEHLTLEHSIFWVNLAEYIYEQDLNDVDRVLPELKTYCEYVTSYCYSKQNTGSELDKWDELERKYILNNLINNFKYFDYSDDVGKNHLKNFICDMLKTADLNDSSIKTLIGIMETIIPDTVDRFLILHNIIFDMCTPDNFDFLSDRPVLQSVLQDSSNSCTLLIISDLKLNILERMEQTANFLAAKDYETAEKVTEELINFKMEYNKMLIPILQFLPDQEAKSLQQAIEKNSPSTLSSTALKSLKILFFMLSSEGISTLNPIIIPFYHNFIHRFAESNQMDLRKWTLKCGTTFALIHEQFSQDMFVLLRKQFFVKPCTEIWKVSVRGIFQLLVRYNLEHFGISHQKSQQQNSCSRDFTQYDTKDDANSLPHVNMLSFMLHILDTCTDDVIFNVVIEGFCQLCLNIDHTFPNIISKLMIIYFDPATDSKVNQLLGVFFKRLIAIGKSFVLESALLPTVNKILDAGYESTLGNVDPKTVIRFVINATNSKYCPDELNVHEMIAESFMKEIQEKLNSKFELVNLLSSELSRLHVNKTSENKLKFLKTIDVLLTGDNVAHKIKQNLINFQKLFSDEPISEISTNPTSSGATEPSNQVVHANLSADHFAKDYQDDDDDDDEDSDTIKEVRAPASKRQKFLPH